MVPKLTRIEVFLVSNLSQVPVMWPVQVVVRVLQHHLVLLIHRLLNLTDSSCLRVMMMLELPELVPMLNFEFRLEFGFFRLVLQPVDLNHR